MIIGVTGMNGSGKDTTASFFVQNGFIHFSLSEIIRDELRQENRELTKQHQIEKGTSLRKQFGNDILARRILEKLEPGKNYIITSIRNRHEIEAFRTHKNFFLIALDADPLIRFQRTQLRHTSTIDPQDFNQFLANDRRESTSEDGSGQELSVCQELANVLIRNDRDLDHLHAQLHTQLTQLKEQQQKLQETETYKRPDWDTYFLGVMEEIGKRATCDRGRSGSIIVKNKRILTTGYVGAPAGLPHCDDAGHQMMDVLAEDSTIKQHCIRTTHAEQNALIQAARFGIAVEGATLYCKMEPCHICAKIIINAGITRVVCKRKYHAGDITRQLFKDANIQIDVIEDAVEHYPSQSAPPKTT